MSNHSLRVVVIDDHTLFRAGLRRLLQDHPAVAEVIEFGNGAEALGYLQTGRADVVLVDLAMPGISGQELVTRIMRSSADMRVVVLTGNTDDYLGKQLLSQGVAGYLTKDCSVDEMLDSLSKVFEHQPFLSTEVARRMALFAADPPADCPFDDLTSRELQITMLLLDGKRNRQIGEKLYISEKTVSSHRTKAFSKLGIQSTAELAKLAMRHGRWPGFI